MRIKFHELENYIKTNQPWVMEIDWTGYKDINSIVRVHDKDYGWYEAPIKSLRRNCTHPKRAHQNRKNKLKNNGKTIQKLKEELLAIQPHVIDIDLSNYENNKSKIKVIDKDYGEYYTTIFILKKGCQHPNRKKERVKETAQKRYGVDNPMQSEQVKKILEKTNLEKYGVANVWLTDKSQEKAWNTKKKNGSFSRSIGQIDLQEFINSLNIGKAETCRINKIEYDIKINNLLIEYNGEYWHNEDQGKDRFYHINKTTNGEKAGYQVVHIWENIWKNRQSQVKSFLRSKLGANENKIYARKCEIKIVAKQQAKDFINKYHIQGYMNKTTHNFGLFLGNNLVAIASFGPHHSINNDQLVLNRFVCLDSTTVVGGLSRLSKFASNYFKQDIISWADRCLSIGNGYAQAGWIKEEILRPNYFYYNKITKQSKTKQSRRKNTIKTPEGMTEKEHAKLDGLSRVWDCGKIRFVYKYKGSK